MFSGGGRIRDNCLTTRDRLFYWFRHANEFKEKPVWLDDPESKALLNATEIAAFTPEKKEQYEQDMKNEQDIEYEKSICYPKGTEVSAFASVFSPFSYVVDVILDS